MAGKPTDNNEELSFVKRMTALKFTTKFRTLQKNLLLFMFLPILAWTLPAHAQYEKPTFGLVIKPIVPSSLFSNTSFSSAQNNISYLITPHSSISIGAGMRMGLYGQLSFETGILYTKRAYDLAITGQSTFAATPFRIVDYEIPALGMIYIRLSEKTFLNTAFGLSFDFFPNDIQIRNDTFQLIGLRRFWIEPALLANVGAEYRTKKYGYFYFGGAYHRMLTNMFALRIDYKENGNVTTFQRYLPGSYFGLELKWFFPNARSEPITW
jgi:hypothetical protein